MNNKKTHRPHQIASDAEDIKALFTAADRQLRIDEERRTQTLALLQQEARSRAVRPLSDKLLLSGSLLRYTDRHLPCLHLLGCIAITPASCAVGKYRPIVRSASSMAIQPSR